MPPDWLAVSPEVAAALAARRAVVALESTLIAHGLPYPKNLATARQAEDAVRAQDAVPATVAVIDGRPTVGLSGGQLEHLAQAQGVRKASKRDLAGAMADAATAATTVSATMALAHEAGIRVFATGGIGGAHPRPTPESPLDISADLTELSRTPVLVVCAGAKSILDLPQTLELLETFGVPVVGFRSDDFPTFYVKSGGGGKVSTRVESADHAARVFAAHTKIGGKGVLLCQHLDEDVSVRHEVFDGAMRQAEAEATAKGVGGSRLTPFLLGRLADLTVGQTLAANQALIVANARLAADVAVCLAAGPG